MKGPGAAYAALLVAVCCIGLAGVMFVQGSPCPDGSSTCSSDALQRLGLLFGLLGLTAPTLVAAIKAGQAADRLNGDLDDRIRAGVTAAQSSRRMHDTRDVDGDPLELHPADPGPAGADVVPGDPGGIG